MKPAAEILFKYLGKGLPNVRSVYYKRTIEAMEEYASQFNQPSDVSDSEKAIRLLYRASPCINNGIQDEQLAEDIRDYLFSIPDREISSWYCPSCKVFVEPMDVTFEETHDPRSGGCGHYVKSTKIDAQIKPTIDKEEKIGTIHFDKSDKELHVEFEKPTIEGEDKPLYRHRCDECDRIFEDNEPMIGLPMKVLCPKCNSK